MAQNRNEQQSFYQLDYSQGGALESVSLRWWREVPVLPCAAALLLLGRLAFVWRQRGLSLKPNETSD
jgi:hypothetical protein